jgi:hypothetical protein
MDEELPMIRVEITTSHAYSVTEIRYVDGDLTYPEGWEDLSREDQVAWLREHSVADESEPEHRRSRPYYSFFTFTERA